jgi:hypothetical protein
MVLYVVGVRRLHLHDFNTFIVTVLALSAAIVAVFVATRGTPSPPDPAE